MCGKLEEFKELFRESMAGGVLALEFQEVRDGSSERREIRHKNDSGRFRQYGYEPSFVLFRRMWQWNRGLKVDAPSRLILLFFLFPIFWFLIHKWF